MALCGQKTFLIYQKNTSILKKGTSNPSKCHLEKCFIVIPVSDLIFDKDLGETNRQNDIVSCVVLYQCQCVFVCVQCTAANKITTSRTLDRLNGMRFVGYFFYSIALGCYCSTDVQIQSAFFYIRILHFTLLLKTYPEALKQGIRFYNNSLQFL